MIPKDLAFQDIAVGATASFARTVTEEDVRAFAALSGDENPLHMDEGYARGTQFGQRVVHGMFLGALCSQLVGMHLPGKRCLYLKQTLSFKKPVFIGDALTVTGRVTAKSEATGLLDIEISIMRGGAAPAGAAEEVAGGIAVVQVLPASG